MLEDLIADSGIGYGYAKSKRVNPNSWDYEKAIQKRYRDLMRGYARELKVGPEIYWLSSDERAEERVRRTCSARSARRKLAKLAKDVRVTWLSAEEE